MSLSDMDQDKHTTMTMHTIQHEYAPTAITLSAYPYYKVKCTHDHERVTLLTMRVHYTKCTTQQGIGKINQTLPYPRNVTKQGTRNIKQASSTSQGYGPTRYREFKIDIVIPQCKIDIVIPKECSPRKIQGKEILIQIHGSKEKG